MRLNGLEYLLQDVKFQYVAIQSSDSGQRSETIAKIIPFDSKKTDTSLLGICGRAKRRYIKAESKRPPVLEIAQKTSQWLTHSPVYLSLSVAMPSPEKLKSN